MFGIRKDQLVALARASGADVKEATPDGASRDDLVAATVEACASAGEFVVVELREVLIEDGAEKTQTVSGRKQYINLDGQVEKGRYDYGRRILLEARIEPKPGSKKRSLARRLVYWHIKPDESNRKGLSHAQAASFNGEGSGDSFAARHTNAAGWARVEFHLSQYGGDSFEVTASTSPLAECPQKKVGPFTVWRRLFFDIAEMKTADGKGKFTLAAATIAEFKAAYEAVFIEFEDTGKRHLGEHHPRFPIVNDGFAWGAKHCSTDGVPFKIHFCAIEGAGAKKPDKQYHLFAMEDADATVFTSSGSISPDDRAKKSWVESFAYKDGETWKPLAPKVTIASGRGYRKYTIDWSGTGVTPTKAAPVKFVLGYRQEYEVLGWGEAGSLHVLICKGYTEDFAPADLVDMQAADTCIHEGGHALGLVPGGFFGLGAVAWETSDKHCKYKSCVMFAASTLKPGTKPGRFHTESVSDPGCATYLRVKALDREAMRGRWGFKPKT